MNEKLTINATNLFEKVDQKFSDNFDLNNSIKSKIRLMMSFAPKSIVLLSQTQIGSDYQIAAQMLAEHFQYDLNEAVGKLAET